MRNREDYENVSRITSLFQPRAFAAAHLLDLAERPLRLLDQIDYVVRRRLIPVPLEGETRRQSAGMRGLPSVSLDLVRLPGFTAALRAEFAHAARAPVPEYLMTLMRQLDQGQEVWEGASGCR